MLREQNAARKEVLARVGEELTELLQYLSSPKFQGEDPDGGRRDIVSVPEMIDRLRKIRMVAWDPIRKS